MTALAFDHVSKRYRRDGPLALEDVTFTIEAGARVCLLGPNGAGKSTAIRVLQGALRPTTGRVSLLGAEVDSPAYLAARRRTGIVPQGPGMYQDLSVAEFLELARELYGRGDVDSVVKLFDLEEHLGKMLVQLSGGYQRRLALAAALLPEPDVLLLDEPTVGLDPVAAHDVHTFLKQATLGRTTLLCTHNLAEAEALCDEVIILRAGRVLVHQPLATLRRRASPRVRLTARQGAVALSRSLEQRGLRPVVEADGVVLEMDDPATVMPDLLRGLLQDGLDVFAVEPMQPTLETLFLDVVRNSS